MNYFISFYFLFFYLFILIFNNWIFIPICFGNNADSNTFLDKNLKRNFNYQRNNRVSFMLLFGWPNSSMHALSSVYILFRKYANDTQLQHAKSTLEIIWLQLLCDFYLLFPFSLSRYDKRMYIVSSIWKIQYMNKYIRLYL